MFNALYKKYDTEVQAHWDKENRKDYEENKQEL